MSKEKSTSFAGMRGDKNVSSGKGRRRPPTTLAKAAGIVVGNAKQQYQRYLLLAEAAEKSGDKVTSESHYQHADHYFRMLRGGCLEEPSV